MDCWILYDQCDLGKNRFFAERLREYASDCGFDARIVTSEMLPDGCPDAVVSRTRDWSLTCRLESLGAKVFNPSSVSRICNDKSETYRFAESLGIPILARSLPGEPLPPGPPWVVKSRTGHGGTEVFLARNPPEIGRIAGSMGSPCLIQEMAPVPGRDMRAYVLNGKVIQCVMRSSDRDFRANHGLGGRAELCGTPETAERIVGKVCGALGPCFVGVDFLFGEDGKMFLNEIEDVVGTRMLYELTDLDPARILIDDVHSKMSL